MVSCWYRHNIIADMCCYCEKVKAESVHKVYNSSGEIELVNPDINDLHIPEHADHPLLNTHVVKGILGFRYENKNSSFVVYSSVETKTFCMIMKLEPLR